eukprot:sb/3466797/
MGVYRDNTLPPHVGKCWKSYDSYWSYATIEKIDSITHLSDSAVDSLKTLILSEQQGKELGRESDKQGALLSPLREIKVGFFEVVTPPLLSRGVVFARDSPHLLSLFGKNPDITGKSIILGVRKTLVLPNWPRNKGVRAKTRFRIANKNSRATQGESSVLRLRLATRSTFPNSLQKNCSVPQTECTVGPRFSDTLGGRIYIIYIILRGATKSGSDSVYGGAIPHLILGTVRSDGVAAPDTDLKCVIFYVSFSSQLSCVEELSSQQVFWLLLSLNKMNRTIFLGVKFCIDWSCKPFYDVLRFRIRFFRFHSLHIHRRSKWFSLK